MKKIIGFILNAAALMFVAYLFYEWFERAFLGGSGDALIPIILIVLIIIGSSLFQQCLEIRDDLQEIKLTSVMFVTQARIEAEYLRALSDYLGLALKTDEQRADLN